MKGVFLSFSILLSTLVPVVAGAEYIDSFESLIEVEADSSFVVTETITYVFDDERHGIFRTIPKTHPEPPSAWYRERFTDLSLESVAMDGNAVPYTVTTERNALTVMIGDPNSTISGSHTYTIRYSVRGGMVFQEGGGAEVYWNVTGTDWDVPLRIVTATILSEDGLLMRERSCYRGRVGEEGSCERPQGDPKSATFRTSNVSPGAGMTIAQAVDRTKVEMVELERYRSEFIWFIGLIIWFVSLSYAVYHYRTALDTTGTVIPQYEPYPGVKPMYAGLLIDGRLDPRDITACIVYLAEQGYLKIHKTEKKVLFFFEVDDYEIELLKPLDEKVSRFEQSVLSLIFEHGAVVGTKVSLGTLRHDLEQQRKNHKTIASLKKDLDQDLEDNSFFQINMSTTMFGGLVTAVVIAGFFLAGSILERFATSGLFVIILIVGSLVILAFARRRRTMKGYEALDHLKGFREFLSVTNKERFAFHNAPKKNPTQFMEYLPYAIAFGVEEKWSDIFKDMTIPNPEWYDGGAAHSFSATNLTTSLGAFSTAFAVSSGSKGSASSGGGSVGGGGGGGGGGSW